MNSEEKLFESYLTQKDYATKINNHNWSLELQKIIIRVYYRDNELDFSTIIFPDTIERIEFCSIFNQNVDNIIFPLFTKYIFFGNEFNQNIDKVKFPDRLLFLKFGNNFNQSIDNCNLPESLEKIQFGNKFNQNISNVKWPSNLKSLIFGKDFNQEINNLPLNLKYLELHDLLKSDNFPVSLEIIRVKSLNGHKIDNIKLPFNCKIILL